MGEKYEKNGALYERGILGNRKIGDIKTNPVGKYIVEKGLGGKFIDIKEAPFGEKIQAHGHRDTNVIKAYFTQVR